VDGNGGRARRERGYGYATGRSIAYASLPPDIDAASDVHVEIEGTWVDAEIATGPLHRPAVAEAAA
jgi:glycine cleavage system aminomethyltransferase T